MSTVTLEEAQARLPELLAELQAGEEVVIVVSGQPLAQLKKTEGAASPRKAGCYKKQAFWMAEDFDAPLEEFKEYMQ